MPRVNRRGAMSKANKRRAKGHAAYRKWVERQAETYGLAPIRGEATKALRVRIREAMSPLPLGAVKGLCGWPYL